MEKTITMFYALLTLLAPAPSGPNPSIVNGSKEYLRAVLAGNAAAVAELYRDDAIEMPPCMPALKGRAAIEQYYRHLFSGPAKISAFTFTPWEATAAGDVGYETGTYRRVLGDVEDTGKYVVIVKHTGGAWKAAYVMYNSDTHQ